jgi:hypothetical protein
MKAPEISNAVRKKPVNPWVNSMNAASFVVFLAGYQLNRILTQLPV